MANYKFTVEVADVLCDVVFDPLDYYRGVSPHALFESAGILPYWIDVKDPRSAIEQFSEKYQFGVSEIKGGWIDTHGVYFYPDPHTEDSQPEEQDAPLYPMFKLERDFETIYFYQYAMVGIVNKETNKQFMTRMD